MTWINTRGLRMGSIVQNIFTVAKIGSLAALVLLGIWFSTDAARAVNFTRFLARRGPVGAASLSAGQSTWMIGTITLVGVAMVGSLFAMDAWNNVTFTAAEVKNPSRNLPLSLALGTGIVILLYTLANVAYLRVLPITRRSERARRRSRAELSLRRRAAWGLPSPK